MNGESAGNRKDFGIGSILVSICSPLGLGLGLVLINNIYQFREISQNVAWTWNTFQNIEKYDLYTEKESVLGICFPLSGDTGNPEILSVVSRENFHGNGFQNVRIIARRYNLYHHVSEGLLLNAYKS